MFAAKFAALASFVSLVAGLTFDVPEHVTSGSSVTINWTSEPSDNVFALYLVNDAFHDNFAIKDAVSPADGTITLTIPAVNPGDGFEIRATNITNINDVYATSGSFSIAAASTTIVSASSTASGSSASASSGVASVTAPASATTTGTTSRFGVTVTSSGSAAGSASGSNSASAPAASASNFNGAASLFAASNSGTFAGMLLAAVAGAAVVAL